MRQRGVGRMKAVASTRTKRTRRICHHFAAVHFRGESFPMLLHEATRCRCFAAGFFTEERCPMVDSQAFTGDSAFMFLH